jgi:hypothetical protein
MGIHEDETSSCRSILEMLNDALKLISLGLKLDLRRKEEQRLPHPIARF